MTGFVLTLIGNATTAPLEASHLKRVWQHLELEGEEHWLAKNEACDLSFDITQFSRGDQTAFMEIVRSRAATALCGTQIDVVCTPTRKRRKKLLVSDMDSTIIDQECIDELGAAIGLGEQICQITKAVVSGNISFSDALRQRMGLMKGMNQSLLEKIYQERITLKTGARTLVQTMAKSGAYCVLVSGGFTFFTSRIARRVGFDDHMGNELLFDEGKLSGEVKEPIFGRPEKLLALKQLCAQKTIEIAEVLAVGDGANDIDMIRGAGLGVAFHGSASLQKQASAAINHADLTALLYIQGFSKNEFVLS